MNQLKINFKTLILAVATSSLLMFGSCSEWLNVQPSNQQSAEDQFSKEEGFKTALAGVYTLMCQPEMYGREMTFGTVDFLGQYWTGISGFSPYLVFDKYDYEAANAKKLVDPIWEKSFNTIANINDLLAFIDVNKGVFSSETTYSLIKGEALALRAYIHFDMLRLFAPNNFKEEGNAEKWLPYIDEYSRTTKLSLTNEEFTKRVMQDLEAASALLKVDPIYTGVESADIYFKNRHFHMNYYAVRALMARVSLYVGEKSDAKTYAEEVYNAQHERSLFRWVTMDEVQMSDMKFSDRLFSSEHIFALNTNRLGDNIKTYFVELSANNNLFLHRGKENMFAPNDDEYRAKFIENKEEGKDVPTKFNQFEENKQKQKRMPLIRISEMYYILAECTGDLKYINQVRVNRGIDEDLPLGTNVEIALTDEIRKEFIGEGQRFYFHKRIQSPKIELEKSDPLYTLIMPENEINFGDRPRPKE